MPSQWIAWVAIAGIASHLVSRFAMGAGPRAAGVPLLVVVVAGGVPLLLRLAKQVIAGEFGADLLAGIAICTSAWLGEYLVAAVVVLMLSGGQALEAYAMHRASSLVDALARRYPGVAHRLEGGIVTDVPSADVRIGDVLVVLPKEICPVDGVVREGISTMDEAYLSGEPFLIGKTAGASVMSGAVNGEGALTIEARRKAVDSRYARITAIVRDAELNRPRMRRLADRLGAWYTPVAVTVAAVSWFASGDSTRFLAVLVIATPCPLLLAIPIVIMGAVSLSASRGIVIKDPAVLERIGTCRTAIFDKTGTLTFGRPALTEVFSLPGFDRAAVLQLAASLEQYSRHPLALAILEAADREHVVRLPALAISEPPGQGLTGQIAGREVRLTSRSKSGDASAQLPAGTSGLETLVVVDGAVAALLRFRDAPRAESPAFIHHLAPRHKIDRTLLVSGDRESEVQYLADVVGIGEIYASQSPEQKVEIVRAETAKRPTLFVGDGLNDAPALLAATVGVALGSQNEITAEAAGAVILDSSLAKVDELLHISTRARRIALQSALGGMALSVIGIGFAAAGHLPALTGAVLQEVIDVAAVLNALRTAWPPRRLTDCDPR